MKARLPQGYGGGGASNMQGMVKQAQKMQDEMKRVQEELEQRSYDVTVGGGAVAITANGKREVLSLTISPDAVDPNDVEMLQDLLIGAVNELLRKIETDSTDEMEKVTGGISMPGLF